MRLPHAESHYPKTLDDLLRICTEMGSSDLHLVSGSPPCVRVHGLMTIIDNTPVMNPADVQAMLLAVMNDIQKDELFSKLELDFSYAIPGVARFRGSIIFQRGSLAAVFRVVPFKVPNLEDLGLPLDVPRLCTLTRGLILVTGPTGSGKSTTLAAIIRRINETRASNIITIEDPIEFLHSHAKSTVRQREVGIDTLSFSNALRQALRHDPDVIMIGEMRDLESISIALTAAETGHLVLSTLHTQTAPLSISRIIDSFPAEAKPQVRQQLSSSLRAVISQQLVPTLDHRRAIAVEYMVESPSIRSQIREGKEHQLYSSIQTGRSLGMQTMDQSLANLYKQGLISMESMVQYSIDSKEVQNLVFS